MRAVRLKDCPDCRDIVAHPELMHGEVYTDEPCPECSSPLSIDLAAVKEDPTTGQRSVVRIAFCTGCEFVREF